MNGPIVGGDSDSLLDSILEKEEGYGDRFKAMSKNVEQWKNTMHSRVRELVVKHGKLAAKAFPGRAAILVKLLGLDSDTIAAVYEKPGSMKIGHYLPGTHIPIESDDEFFALAKTPPVLINFAWHIPAEINAYLKHRGYTGEVIDIMNPREFSIPA